MKFVNDIVSKAGKTLVKVKNANATPKVMLITGIVTVVGAGVYACKQTLKLEDKIDEAKANIDHVKELKEAGEYCVNSETNEMAEYTPALYRKDMTYAWGSGIWSVGKLYLPSAIATGVGIALIGGSNKILTDRLTQTTLALTAMSDAYNKYRRNVIREYGEDVDLRMRTGLETKKNLEMKVIDPETGELVEKKEKKIDVIEDVSNVASPYAFILNDCDFWTSDGNYNTTCIESYIRILQAKYDRDGYIYLYDIYKTFGAFKNISAAAIAMSHQVGLVKGHADDEIRINLIPTHLGSEDYFKDILLMDINCCGAINDLVARRAWLDREAQF